jgi:mRNA-degrading endonuclease RelE of RelBE toxin-antitoxin system
MNHFTLPGFWRHYQMLPKEIREQADKSFATLQSDPSHPSLRFKKVGRKKHLWSARVGSPYRALRIDKPEGVVWFWIGTHAEYDTRLS